MTFREREEALFARWAKAYEKNGVDFDQFVYDGVLFRGECKNVNGCWDMQPGEETELWRKAKCRLLILTKDATRNGGLEDVRIESVRQNHKGTKVMTSGSVFYRNLTLWSYALINARLGGEILPYDDMPTWDELREFYCSAAIARVNCKKQIGESSVSNSELRRHIVEYADFLAEQVAMYDADVILCCGGVIKDFVKERYLPDLVRFSDNDWVYYSPSTRKLVINSYHPSYLKKCEIMYEDMMADVRDYLTMIL